MGLKDLVKRGRENKPPIILLYGVQGIGKSTWASEAENAIFQQTEEGLTTLDVAKFEKAQSVDEVFANIGLLAKEDHEFKTYVLDTVDWFEQLVHKKVRAIHGANIFTEYAKGFNLSIPYFHELIEGLQVLRNKKNMAIILIGHARTGQYNSPDTANYDRYMPDLHKDVSSAVQEAMDIVLFANYKVYVNQVDAGFGKKEGKAAGKGDRVVFTQERPAHFAKNRYNLPPEMPMDYGAFLRAMAAGLESMKKSKHPAQQEIATEPATA